MERKSDKVRRLVADGDFKGALRIANAYASKVQSGVPR